MKCNYFLVNQLSEYDQFIKEKKLDMKKIKIINALISNTQTIRVLCLASLEKAQEHLES